MCVKLTNGSQHTQGRALAASHTRDSTHTQVATPVNGEPGTPRAARRRGRAAVHTRLAVRGVRWIPRKRQTAIPGSLNAPDDVDDDQNGRKTRETRSRGRRTLRSALVTESTIGHARLALSVGCAPPLSRDRVVRGWIECYDPAVSLAARRHPLPAAAPNSCKPCDTTSRTHRRVGV